jgi:hypothetical protein
MRVTTFFLGIMALALISFSPLSKDDTIAAPWKFIADKWVGWNVDHDVIHTGNINDDFRQLRLRVTDGPLKVYDMKVHFDNGEVQDVPLRVLIPKGRYSRIIDLNGGLRHISKIEFWYETKGFAKGKARVAVWGRK